MKQAKTIQRPASIAVEASPKAAAIAIVVAPIAAAIALISTRLPITSAKLRSNRYPQHTHTHEWGHWFSYRVAL